jgi:sugar lactone lactonase YvrE
MRTFFSSSSLTTPSVEAQVAAEVKCHLGEGSIWDRRSKKLIFLDILESKIYRFDPVAKSTEGPYDLNGYSTAVSSIVPVDEKGDPTGTLVGLTIKEGFAVYNFVTKELSKLGEDPYPGEIENVRFNDGKVDPKGRYWAGTITRDKTGEPCVGAKLFRRDADGTVTEMLSGTDISISNGIAWSADKSTMYYTDTPSGKVDKYAYDNETGSISEPQPCITGFDFQKTGFPDGCTLDKDGKLWVARFNGGCAGRYDPETGKLLAEVKVPAQAGKQVTSVAFGGDTLEDLYLTTAREGFDEATENKYPLAGNLFVVPKEKLQEIGAVGGPPVNHLDYDGASWSFNRDCICTIA